MVTSEPTAGRAGPCRVGDRGRRVSRRVAKLDDWYERYEAGDAAACDDLVDACYERLLQVARRRLNVLPPSVADAEGAVISALRSFFSGVDGQRFTRLDDRDNLWRVLATITSRKAVRQLRQHWKQSGEGDRIDRAVDVQRLLSAKPLPDDEAVFREECERCLDLLPDDRLRQVALLVLQGCDTRDISDRLAIHIRSVQRKVRLIESIWLSSAES